MKGFLRMALLISFLIFGSFVPESWGADIDSSWGERLRRSNQLRGVSDFQREMTVALFQKQIRALPLLGEFQSRWVELKSTDEGMRKLYRIELGKRGEGYENRLVVEELVQGLLPALEQNIGLLLSRSHEAKEKLGMDPTKSPIRDEELFRVMSQMNVSLDQLMKLYDYQELLVAGLLSVDRKKKPDSREEISKGIAELPNLLKERSRVTGEISKIKKQLTEIDTDYQTQTILLTDSLGNPEIRKEIAHYRMTSKQLDRILLGIRTTGRDEKKQALNQMQKLISYRLESLSRLSGDPKTVPPPGPKSLLLCPVTIEPPKQIPPLAKEWEQLQKELIDSLKLRAIRLANLHPQLVERNRLLLSLMASPKAQEEFSLLNFLLNGEGELLKKFTALWNNLNRRMVGGRGKGGLQTRSKQDYCEYWVDLGLQLELFLPLELQLIREIGRWASSFTQAGPLPGQDLSSLSAQTASLADLLGRMDSNLAAFELLAQKEEVLWGRFDAFLKNLLNERQRTWEEIQKGLPSQALSSGEKVSNSTAILSDELNHFVAGKVAEYREDWKKYEELQSQIKSDVIMRILYGRAKYSGWRTAVNYADLIAHCLFEISQKEDIVQNCRLATQQDLKTEIRELALIRLIKPLAISWDIKSQKENIIFLVALDEITLRFIHSERKGPFLELLRERAGRTEPVYPQSPARYDFVLQAAVIGADFEENWRDRFANQWETKGSKWGYYAIAAVGTIGAVAVGAAAAPVVLGGAALAATLNLVVDGTVSAGHAYIDTAQQRGETGRFISPETGHKIIDGAETVYNIASIVNGIRQINKALDAAGDAAQAGAKTEKGVKTAEQGLELAQQSRRASEQAAARPWYDLAQRAMERGDLGEYNRLRDMGDKAGDIRFYGTEATSNIKEAARNLRDANYAADQARRTVPSFMGLGEVSQEGSQLGEVWAGRADTVGDEASTLYGQLAGEPPQRNGTKGATGTDQGGQGSKPGDPPQSVAPPSAPAKPPEPPKQDPPPSPPTASGTGTTSAQGHKPTPEEQWAELQRLQALGILPGKGDKPSVIPGPDKEEPPVKPPDPPLPPEPPVDPTEGNKGSGEPTSVTTGVTPPQDGDPSKGPADPTTGVPADTTTGTTGPAVGPTTPTTGPDLVSQLQAAEGQTNLGTPTGPPSAGGDKANLQMALNTNVTGSFQQNRDQVRGQEAQQTLGSMGGTQAERAAAAQNLQMQGQSGVQGQGQATTHAIAGNAQEFMSAQQILQVVRQNAAGNILMGSFWGGLTTGGAIALNNFFWPLGQGGGQQWSVNLGIQPQPPAFTTSTSGSGSTGTQTTGGQTGSTTPTTTTTGGPTSGGPATGLQPQPSPGSTGPKGCRQPGFCNNKVITDRDGDGCCDLCGKMLKGKGPAPVSTTGRPPVKPPQPIGGPGSATGTW
jgi:hypothetical protein